MNNPTVDLHGLTENEAIPVIMSALMDLEMGSAESIEFITGNGHVLTRVLEELLEEDNWDYEVNPNNRGSYRVF